VYIYQPRFLYRLRSRGVRAEFFFFLVGSIQEICRATAATTATARRPNNHSIMSISVTCLIPSCSITRRSVFQLRQHVSILPPDRQAVEPTLKPTLPCTRVYTRVHACTCLHKTRFCAPGAVETPPFLHAWSAGCMTDTLRACFERNWTSGDRFSPIYFNRF
jgi:hypothetical protein